MDVMKLHHSPPAPPHCHCRYKGHVPSVASSFGSPYGTTTFKYFQDLRNTALEKSYALLSGGRFPTIFSPNPSLVLASQVQSWDRWLHLPIYTRFNLDSRRNFEINNFYQVSCPQRQPGKAWTAWEGWLCLFQSFRARGDLP